MAELQPTYRKGITFGTRRTGAEEPSNGDEIKAISDNFPKHRTLLLTPNDEPSPQGKKVDIVVTEEVLLSTANHVAQDTSKESGGFLLGNRYECPNTNRKFIVIDQFMKADYTEGTQVSLTFTTDAWAQLKNRLEGKYRGKELVGWYHSHPGMGIFLSNYDVDIHKGSYFNKDWQVALVLDPVKHEGGFFGFVDGNLSPREKLEFYELLEGESRETVVAWTNYSAEDPKTGSSAELKAVNTQNFDGTNTAPANPVPKTQTVTSGGLLNNPLVLIGGLVTLGIFLLGTVFAGYWLYTRNSGTTNSNTTTDNPTVVNKVLNGDRIKVSRDLKGWVSTTNKMWVEMQINNIGETEIIEEIRKEDNLQIEINGQPARVIESSIDNGAILKVKAETDLPEDVAEGFRSGKPQDLDMTVDMFYNGDTISRKIKSKYQKGNKTESQGLVAEFGDFQDQNVVPVRTNPKQKVVDNKPVEQEKPVQQQKQQTTKTPPKSKQTPGQTSGDGTTGSGTLDSQIPQPTRPTPKPKQTSTPKPRTNKRGGTTGGCPLGIIDC